MPKTTHFNNAIVKLLAGILFLGMLTGCGGTIKNSWSNFRAYYNTYYNAEQNYRAGLTKVEQQPVEIDPREPVRIHPVSVQAGNSDFQNAIDKGAQILRKFPNSKWFEDGVDCQIMRAHDAKGWRQGKIRVKLNIEIELWEDNEESQSPLDNFRDNQF